MKAFCALFVLTLSLATPPRAGAVDLAPGRLLWVEGQRGIWWPDTTALVLRDEHVHYPLLEAEVSDLRSKIKLLDQELSLKAERVVNWQRNAALSETEAQRASAALEGAIKAREAAETARDAWWRRPALWFCVGLVVGAGTLAVGFSAAN